MGRIRHLLSHEGDADTDPSTAVGQLTRQCRALARAVSACGAGISVIDAERLGMSLATSGPRATELDGLQFTVGEGPSLEAFDLRRPVLEPDLSIGGGTRWPGYTPAISELGVRSVFAFPMQVGAARLAVLALYREETGPLPSASLNDALDFAALGVETMLTSAPNGDLIQDAEGVLDHHAEVYQAQGMVMVQLGIPLDEAMVRMRAHAYGHNIPLSRLATDIVANRTTLDGDHVDGTRPDA
ncbi:GAF and ANTAR domain-containing protein [Ornithinimicrobium sp. LYQ92]|uniref:GAF and ANTAR domain-containing protein n=1 Tax=Serinicoccus sp. LYQ92 TaxID=3378798 RepID=UPI003854C07A